MFKAVKEEAEESQEGEREAEPKKGGEVKDPGEAIFGRLFWIRLAFGILLTATIFLLCYFLGGRTLTIASDASFGNFAILVAFAFFSGFSAKGWFDGIGYGMTYMSSFLTRAFRGGYGDYVERRRERRALSEKGRWPFLAYLLLALLWLVPTIALYLASRPM